MSAGAGPSPHRAELPKPKPDKAGMRAALDTMFDPDQVIELRALHKGRKRTDAGYFDGEHRDALVNEAARLNAAGAAVYVTMNKIDPQLLGRCCNRVQDYVTVTVTDKDVIRRRWLLTDFDPVRPTDTSATDVQVAAAEARASACCDAMKAEGWPDPLIAASGNGAHLLYPIDLPNDAESTALVKGALAGVAAQFDTETVKVDQAVFNGGRITKAYGTVATKGDHTPLTPWRLSTMVSSPDRDVVVTADQLRALHPKGNGVDPKAGRAWGPGDLDQFDLPAFLMRLGIAYDQDMHEGADRYKLDHCPFNLEHGRGEAAIFRQPNGRLGFKCQHESCLDKHWQDVRALVNDPGGARKYREAEPRGPAKSETEAPAGGSATIAEVLEVFHRWLYLPDEGSVYVPLGAVAANLMDGDPVWVMVVGPPSGGKTESIVAIATLPYVRLGATLTEAALLSGTPKKQSVGKGGLLREIGDFGILVLKDFTSILSMNRDQRAQLLAALREIFDGSWTRHIGADGGRTLAWSGKLGLIAGCTAAIDSHHAVMSVMGERFLLYRLPTIDPTKQAERALANAGQVGVMRKELAAVVKRLFAGLDISEGLPSIDEHETSRLVALSSLVAAARSAIERDPYRREIELIYDREAPARLAQTLRRLYAGMIAIGLDAATAWPLVAKAGLDCVPKLRRSVFDALLVAPDWRDTTAIAAATNHPTVTTRRALEDLTAHGVVERQVGGRGKADRWILARLARDQYAAVGVSETSKPDRTARSSSLLLTPLHVNDDITGVPSQTAPECGLEGEKPTLHCWACKAEIGKVEPCPSCGWMICACGACSPECAGGEAPGRRRTGWA